jgi:hypothetical protein
VHTDTNNKTPQTRRGTHPNTTMLVAGGGLLLSRRAVARGAARAAARTRGRTTLVRAERRDVLHRR